MKKSTLAVILFIIFFVAGYIGTCYLIPGLRIKLSASPVVYFIESLRHMVLIKSLLALAAASLAAAAVFIPFGRKGI